MNELLLRLSEPFEPKQMSWKPGAAKDNKCLALAYGDLRAYQDRLDEVCGLDWSIEYLPWGDSRIIARLTIHGVTRSSTGESDAQDEKNNMAGSVSEAMAFKRAAAQFGLGRYLYDLPPVWVEFDPQRKRITDGGQKELEHRYAAWYAKKKALPTTATTVTNGNGNGYHEDELWEPRETVKAADTLSKVQLARITLLGADVCGKEAFEQTDATKLALWASDKKVNEVNKLSPMQADKAIKFLETKLAEKQPA